MITYKNISASAKTFYGVKFNPGETQSVPGYINSPSMVRILGIKTGYSQKTINPVTPVPTITRGRKKKTTDSEKETVVEPEVKITETISEEETTDGNPS